MSRLSTSMFNVGCSMFNVLSCLLILTSGLSTAQTQEELNSQLHLQAQPHFERLPTGEKMFSWIGQSDHTYFIQASPDLLDWTWAPNIEPGVDAPMSYEVDGPTAAGFFRLIRTDQTAADLDAADFDNDGLSNNFELTPRPRPGGIIGFANLNPNIQTHPLRADTDGDGLSDKWELENGFDPTDNGTRDPKNGPNGDPDGDGVDDSAEMGAGTDPKDGADFGPQIISVTRYGWGSSGSGNPIWRYASWLPEPAEYIYTSEFSLYIASGYATLLTYPAQPPENPSLRETLPAENGAYIFSYDDDRVGTDYHRLAFSQKRLWIKAPPKPIAQEFCYLKVETRVTNTPGQASISTTKVEPIVFTIAANQTLSDSINVLELPDAVANSECILHCYIKPLGVKGYWTTESGPQAVTTIGVFPGNVTITEKQRAYIRDPITQLPLTQDLSELKIAQWGDAFDPSGTDWQFSLSDFELDFDAFQVRLPDRVAPPASGKHQIQISTLKEDGSILDSGAIVELDNLESQKLCLVADEDDDLYPVDGKADGAPNDRTYLAEPGGRMRLQWLTPPSGNVMVLGEISIPVKKVVTVQGFILKSGVTSPSPVTTVPQANAYFERARRILATCGVKLVYSASDVPANPVGVVFGGTSPFKFDQPKFETDHIEMTPESMVLMDSASCKPPEGVIPVYFVGSFAETADGKILNGCSNSRSLMQPGESEYADAVFINTTSSSLSGSTVAHELMHILFDGAHNGTKILWKQIHEERPYSIWYTSETASIIESGITARRRVEDSMRFRLLKSPFCKKP